MSGSDLGKMILRDRLRAILEHARGVIAEGIHDPHTAAFKRRDGKVIAESLLYGSAAVDALARSEAKVIDAWHDSALRMVKLLCPDHHDHVVRRQWLWKRWPPGGSWDVDQLPFDVPHALTYLLAPRWAGWAPGVLANGMELADDGAAEPGPLHPDNVAAAEVRAWAKPRLVTALEAAGVSAAEADACFTGPSRALGPVPSTVYGVPVPCAWSAAVLYLAERDVLDGRRAKVGYLSADPLTHTVITGWGAVAARATKRETLDLKGSGEWQIALFDPADPARKRSQVRAQLGLPLPERAMTDALLRALHQVAGPMGLRDYLALWLAASQAGRHPSFVLTMSDHLGRIGIIDNARNRRAACERLHVIARLHFEACLEDFRITGSLITIPTAVDVHDGAEWSPAGVRVTLNEDLYQGVRNASGAIGNRFTAFPADLLKEHPSNESAALLLGAALAIRFQWARTRGYVDLLVPTALEAAGINADHGPGRALERLEAAITTLQAVGSIDRAEWLEPGRDQPGPRDMKAKLRLWAPSYLLDRFYGLKPEEAKHVSSAVTGADLLEWRKKRGWTQEAAAAALQLSRRTIASAESKPAAPLTRRVRQAVSNVQERDHASQ